jgi:pyridoxamine 5'-phosphate oxidase
LTALKKEGIDWELKRRQIFDSMSGHMKASWCRPPPGSKLEGGYGEAKKWPQRLPKLGEDENEEDKKNLEVALGNFALVVIDPFEVDFVELGVVPNQRTKFTRNGEHWVEEVVVP